MYYLPLSAPTKKKKKMKIFSLKYIDKTVKRKWKEMVVASPVSADASLRYNLNCPKCSAKLAPPPIPTLYPLVKGLKLLHDGTPATSNDTSMELKTRMVKTIQIVTW